MTSQTKDSDIHVVQDYSEEYEVSPYGSEEALDTLDDLKISMSAEKDLDLKHLSFLIENTSDKEYRYSPNYFEIEEIRERLQAKLMRAILTFRAE